MVAVSTPQQRREGPAPPDHHLVIDTNRWGLIARPYRPPGDRRHVVLDLGRARRYSVRLVELVLTHTRRARSVHVLGGSDSLRGSVARTLAASGLGAGRLSWQPLEKDTASVQPDEGEHP